MQRQIPPEGAFSWTAPTLAPILAALRVTCTLRGSLAAPEEVREPPEHTGGRRWEPRRRAIAHRNVGDQRRGEVDGEAGVDPLLEPRRHRREHQNHAEEFGPRD